MLVPLLLLYNVQRVYNRDAGTYYSGGNERDRWNERSLSIWKETSFHFTAAAILVTADRKLRLNYSDRSQGQIQSSFANYSCQRFHLNFVFPVNPPCRIGHVYFDRLCFSVISKHSLSDPVVLNIVGDTEPHNFHTCENVCCEFCLFYFYCWKSC